MSKKTRTEKLIEAAEKITAEFQTKGFKPHEAIYTLFVSFMNISICSSEPVIACFQFMEFLSKWQLILYDEGKIKYFEEEIFNNLLKNLDLQSFDINEI